MRFHVHAADPLRLVLTKARRYPTTYQPYSPAGTHAPPPPLQRREITYLKLVSGCNLRNQVQHLSGNSIVCSAMALNRASHSNASTVLHVRALVAPPENASVSPCHSLCLPCSLQACPSGHRSPCMLTTLACARSVQLGQALHTCFIAFLMMFCWKGQFVFFSTVSTRGKSAHSDT